MNHRDAVKPEQVRELIEALEQAEDECRTDGLMG